MSLLSWLKPKAPTKHVCDPADATISSETTGAAIEILKTARPLWLRRGWPVDWGGPDNASRAFALYNLHHQSRRQGMGCAPCHIAVFNWLMDEAFKDVQITRR